MPKLLNEKAKQEENAENAKSSMKHFELKRDEPRQYTQPSETPVAEKVREALNELGNHNHFDHTMMHGAGCKTCIRQKALKTEALALLDKMEG